MLDFRSIMGRPISSDLRVRHRDDGLRATGAAIDPHEPGCSASKGS